MGRVAQVANGMVGAPYRLGGRSRSEGFDCASYLMHFYRGFGAPVGDRWGEYTPENYHELYQFHPNRARRRLFLELRRLGEPRPWERMLPGDLLLYRDADGKRLTAIYVGADNCMTCDQRIGVMVVPRKFILAQRMEVLNLCPKPSP